MADANNTLPDGEIARYIDAQLDESSRQKIESSAELRQEAAAYKQLVHSLQALLYRKDCPSTDALGEFYIGLTDKQTHQTIAQHITTCPHCMRELMIFREQLGEPLSQPSMLSRIKMWVAQQFPNNLAEGRQLIPVMRGTQASPQQFAAPGGIRLTLSVHDDPQNNGYKQLIGIFIEIPSALTVQLWQGGQLLTIVSVDDLDRFMMNALKPGTYELIIQGTDLFIHIQALNV